MAKTDSKNQGEQKNLGGRPRAVINYELLDELCTIQCTKREIAAVLKIDEDTLNAALKRDGHGGFSAYYEKKSEVGKTSLRRKQIQTAMNGNVVMLIWLGKQYLGQADKQDLGIAAQIVYKIADAQKPKPQSVQ